MINFDFLWRWVENHQTFSAGVLGFFGVIATLAWNAWLYRRQRREERRHERQSLRAALIEELGIIKSGLSKAVEEYKDTKDKEAAYVPNHLMNDVYNSFVGRIGVLNQEEVRKLMYAYLSWQQYIYNLHLIGMEDPRTPKHVNVPQENRVYLNYMQSNLINTISQAINTLEREQSADNRKLSHNFF